MRAIYLGATALLAAALLAGPALARDNCPRLPSSSLVILIPEGGCDADASALLEETRGVSVILGRARVDMIRTASIGSTSKAQVRVFPQGMRGGASVIFINIDQSRD
jgi:hypothetical protein